MAKTNWIAGATKHKGALHRKLGVPEGTRIPAGKIAKAAKAGGVLGKEARLAQTLTGLRSHMPAGASQSPRGDIGAKRGTESVAVGGFGSTPRQGASGDRATVVTAR